jgi:hypothetical protein
VQSVQRRAHALMRTKLFSSSNYDRYDRYKVNENRQPSSQGLGAARQERARTQKRDTTPRRARARARRLLTCCRRPAKWRPGSPAQSGCRQKRGGGGSRATASERGREAGRSTGFRPLDPGGRSASAGRVGTGCAAQRSSRAVRERASRRPSLAPPSPNPSPPTSKPRTPILTLPHTLFPPGGAAPCGS